MAGMIDPPMGLVVELTHRCPLPGGNAGGGARRDCVCAISWLGIAEP
jgi:hypothetical protein